MFDKLDLDESYKSLFELLWYSQLPCFDVEGVTSTKNHQYGNIVHSLVSHDVWDLQLSYQIYSGMIKRCKWKGQMISCSSIFSMYPTDRGMCCTFNKQKADEMFENSRYTEQLHRLSSQDKNKSFTNSTLPEWLRTINTYLTKQFIILQYLIYNKV